MERIVIKDIKVIDSSYKSGKEQIPQVKSLEFSAKWG